MAKKTVEEYLDELIRMFKNENLLVRKNLIRVRRKIINLIKKVQRPDLLFLLQRLTLALYYVDMVYRMMIEGREEELNIFGPAYLVLAYDVLKLAKQDLEEKKITMSI